MQAGDPGFPCSIARATQPDRPSTIKHDQGVRQQLQQQGLEQSSLSHIATVAWTTLATPCQKASPGWVPVLLSLTLLLSHFVRLLALSATPSTMRLMLKPDTWW